MWLLDTLEDAFPSRACARKPKMFENLVQELSKSLIKQIVQMESPKGENLEKY